MSDKALRKQLDKDEALRVRKIIMCNPGLVRELCITHEQERLYKFVAARYESTAHEISKEFSCSIQSASTRLNNLCKKGYLKRRRSIHNSGGLEYYYMTFSRADYLNSIPKQNRSLRSG